MALETSHFSSSSAVTIAEKHLEQHAFTWSIENFMNIDKDEFIDIAESQTTVRPDPRKGIKSSTFEMNSGLRKEAMAREISWQLVFYPRVKIYKGSVSSPSETRGPFIGLELQLRRDSKLSRLADVQFEMSLVSSTGVKVHVKRSALIQYWNPRAFHGWLDFLPCETLIEDCEALLTGQSLTFRCEITINHPNSYENMTSLEMSHLDSNLKKIPFHLQPLPRCEKFSDVKIQCCHGTLNAHKAMLFARAHGFLTFLEERMEEKGSDDVVIKHTSSGHPCVVEALLGYIYTGEVKDTVRNCLNLYAEAHQYGITGLKRFCTSVIVRDLSISTMCATAVLGYTHGDDRLFQAVKTFVKMNISAVLTSTAWINFMQQNTSIAILLLKP